MQYLPRHIVYKITDYLDCDFNFLRIFLLYSGRRASKYINYSPTEVLANPYEVSADIGRTGDMRSFRLYRKKNWININITLSAAVVAGRNKMAKFIVNECVQLMSVPYLNAGRTFGHVKSGILDIPLKNAAFTGNLEMLEFLIEKSRITEYQSLAQIACGRPGNIAVLEYFSNFPINWKNLHTDDAVMRKFIINKGGQHMLVNSDFLKACAIGDLTSVVDILQTGFNDITKGVTSACLNDHGHIIEYFVSTFGFVECDACGSHCGY